MGFIDHIKQLITKQQDPEKILEQAVYSLKVKLKNSKTFVAQAIANEKRLHRQLNDYINQEQEWEDRARQAIKKGNDESAKQALLKKQSAENYRVQLEEFWKLQHQNVENYKKALRELQKKIDDTEREKFFLIAQARQTNNQLQIEQILNSANDNQIYLSEFEKSNFDTPLVEADLERQFKQLENQPSSADNLLDALKKQMEKNEPAQ